MNAKLNRGDHGRGSRDDFRVICTCQIHAGREGGVLRRSLRAARRVAGSVRTRGIALMIGIPLALGTIDFPIEATSMTIPEAMKVNRIVATARPTLASTQATAIFPIFTTRRVRDQFLSPRGQQRNFTVEVAREHFFMTHVPFGSIIYREARRQNLPPELVAAVVAAESDFRPRLISHKNARGLMQIIPSTGRMMGAADLFNPDQNIAAGAKYLRYLFDRFGDQRTVLAAYNAGEGNVEKFGGVPPFPETINYVTKVNSRTASYRQRIQGTYLASLRMRNSMVGQ